MKKEVNLKEIHAAARRKSILETDVFKKTGPLEICLTTWDTTIEALAQFKEKIGDQKSVLYPCCMNDISPSKVFSNVMYVDINSSCVQALKNNGFDAKAIAIQDYEPSEKADLLILINPMISASDATGHLKVGGYVAANDYHYTATSLSRNSNFRLIDSFQSTDSDSDGLVELKALLANNNLSHQQIIGGDSITSSLKPAYLYLFQKISE